MNSSDLMASLVKSISSGLEEFLVAKAKTIPNAQANFGLVIDAEKVYAGKKVQQICQKFAIIVGLKSARIA